MANEIKTTAENLHAQVEEALHPEENTTDYAVRLYWDEARTKAFDVTLRMYPLPVKQTRHINGLTKAVEDGSVSTNEQMSEVLISVCVYLFSIYKVEGATKPVIENSLDIEDIRNLVNKQLEVCRNSDFLLLPLASLLKVVEGMEQGREQLGQIRDTASRAISEVAQPPDENPENPSENDPPSPEQSS